MENTQGQVLYLLLRCIWCIRSRCHSFRELSRQKLRQRFPTAAIAATYMRPHWGRDYRNVWRSRIADRNNAPRSVSRARSGFRGDCVGGVCGNNYRNVVCPLALRSLKTLRALGLGKKTCGNVDRWKHII